jgi:hypothetical protein
MLNIKGLYGVINNHHENIGDFFISIENWHAIKNT